MKKVALITGVIDQDGSGLAAIVRKVTPYKGDVVFDTSKPDDRRES
jgi:GDP-D-mannose dehydratase